MTKANKKLKAMENSEKMKEEKAMINSEINGDDEDTSSVINKGTDRQQVGAQDQNGLKPSPSAGDYLAINIEQETVAINSNNADPSISETQTDHSSPLILKNEQEEKLKSDYKAKMGEVREENERLKLLLARIVADYQSLQSQFLDILRQQETKRPKPSTGPKSADDDDHHHHGHKKNDEEPRDDQLVSLSLGRTSSTSIDHDEPRKNEITKKTGSGSNGKDLDDQRGFNDGELALALGSLSETTKNSSSHDNIDDKDGIKEDDQEVEPTEMWPPSKVLKTARSSGVDHHDDGVSQSSPLKKARVSVRTRCDGPTMNDGCQWRKYGQKIAKGNPCPRAYYRCTVSPSCPVRKQVQRCAEDMSILITTYEGTHNHPLPISATAMASTTSAAASMLQSHSTTSSSPQPALLLPSAISGPISAATSSNPNLPAGPNFTTSTTTGTTTLFQNSIIGPSPHQQLYFPNTSFSTLNSHPTVTLDLTLPNHPYSSHILGRGLSSNISSAPRFPSTSLSFSSSSPPPSSLLEPINNHYNGFFSYRNNYPVGSNGNYNKQPPLAIQEPSFCQSYMNSTTTSNNNNSNINQSIGLTNQQSLTETISAATKAITSNPKFQSALAAALTSYVGHGGSGV